MAVPVSIRVTPPAISHPRRGEDCCFIYTLDNALTESLPILFQLTGFKRAKHESHIWLEQMVIDVTFSERLLGGIWFKLQ